MIGETLGHYRVLDKIDEGGMGVVYRAYDERLERQVALKILSPGTLTDEAARKRFRKEALALAKLNHPNIGVIYDFDAQDGVDFLVMEFIAGTNLTVKLAGRTLPEKEVMTLGTQIAAALEEAHEHGIVHRDLKPGNILVTSRGHAKVLDFGLARLLHPVGEESTTETTSISQEVAGTLPYMAPEQLRGEKADARADIHALGAVLFEMSTGRRPFRGNTAPQLTDAILHELPVAPRALNSRISADLERIILKCLEKEPENRYQSARELSVDLRRLGAPSTATVVPAKRPALRRQLFLSAAGMFLVAFALVVVMNLGGLRNRFVNNEGPRNIKSLAVLPLENMSGDSSQDYFSEAMTEELTNELASLRSLEVISRNSASRYQRSSKSLREIAGELKVDALIEGSVIRSDGQVRITVQLIDGATDKHLWSKRYDRPAGDVLGLQREVARAVTQEIHLTLTPAEEQRFGAPTTRNSEAYESYLRATYHLATSLDENNDADAAIAQAEQAVALDPNFAEAYVTLAEGCAAKIFQWQGGHVYDEKAFVALGKALALNSNLAEAYAARGELYYNKLHDFDIARAVADYHRAISLNPNLAKAHHSLGAELTHFGLHDKAIEEFRITLRLDPYHAGAKARLARALWQSQRFTEALEQYERDHVVNSEMAVTLAYLGRRKDAWETIENVTRLAAEKRVSASENGDIAAVRAFLYATEGKRKEAEQESELAYRLGKDHDHFHHAAFILAAASAELGKTRDAITWLKRAAESGMPNYPLFHDNPSMRKLHGDPAYERFMAQLKLHWDQLAGSFEGVVAFSNIVTDAPNHRNEPEDRL
jgi:serine/threonine protein kinase/lipoprotein NlpI